MKKNDTLKSQLTKLAFDHKEFREDLLPLLEKYAMNAAPRHRDLYIRTSGETTGEESIFGLDLYVNNDGYLVVGDVEVVRKGPWPLPFWVKKDQWLELDWVGEFMKDTRTPVYNTVALPGKPFTSDFRMIKLHLERLFKERSQ